MKQIQILSAGLILSIICMSAKAQEMQNSKPLLVHTVYLNTTADTRMINIDSILQIMKKYVLEPN